MKLSSDLCAGISLIGALVAACFAFVGLVLLLFSQNSGKMAFVILSIPGFFAGVIIFGVFYRESKRIRQVEAEEELIRKLAIEKLEKDKLST